MGGAADDARAAVARRLATVFEKRLPALDAEARARRGPAPWPDDVAFVEAGICIDPDEVGEGGEWALRIAPDGLTCTAGPPGAPFVTWVQDCADFVDALDGVRGGPFGALFAGLDREGVSSLPDEAFDPSRAAAPLGRDALAAFQRLDASLRVLVTDDEQGEWCFDLAFGEEGPFEPDEDPTTTLVVTLADAQALWDGAADPVEVLMGRRVEILGELAPLLRIQAILLEAGVQAWQGLDLERRGR